MKKDKALDRLEDKVARRLADFVAKRTGVEKDSEKYVEYVFASQVQITNGLKNLILFGISLAMGVFPYVLAMSLTVWRLRKYSFGVHMPGSLSCMLEGMIVYLGGAYLALRIVAHWLDLLCAFLLVLAGLLRYAPAATKMRPIPDGTKAALKELSKQTACVFGGLSFFLYFVGLAFPVVLGVQLHALSVSIVLGLAVQVIHLLPFMFAIFER